MKPEGKSFKRLSVTRSKAKMYEYNIHESYHIAIKQDPAELFRITIAILGDLSASICRNDIDISTQRENLLFAAHFFDSYNNSQLNPSLSEYVILLNSAAYYLCNMPGNASLLSNTLQNCPNLNGGGIEFFLLWLLKNNNKDKVNIDGEYKGYLDKLIQLIRCFYSTGDTNRLTRYYNAIRRKIYRNGTPRQLLLIDIACAVLIEKINNSTWMTLPQYSGIDLDSWREVIRKDNFITELWPSQHLLGRFGVFKGNSAVIQLPTSAGKTKASEIIIRSRFLSKETYLAVVVAPFRALCHEIVEDLLHAFSGENVLIDELSESMQDDYEINLLLEQQRIIVLTPEKLFYLLRQYPDFAGKIGLIIFDEGHQFDNGIRGLTYELLLTSLKLKLHEKTQKVLISAVMSNADAIAKWLNGNSLVVGGENLLPTYRSIGFTSWIDTLGRIEYVDPSLKQEYFVPRVIERKKLNRLNRERKNRYFPDKNDGKTIALYLGLKLISKGGVAIFCGRKRTVLSILEKLDDCKNRGINLDIIASYSDITEIKKLHNLYLQHMGISIATTAAEYGVYTHHSSVPNGIRFALEYAMHKGLVRFVICTSTLAQGVNLPIRYLIITGVYQGTERIKVRDFHNLLGRTARAGKYTEGSVLFADNSVYDNKTNRKENWRWNQTKQLLNRDNSEPCTSTLLSLFEPIKSMDEKYILKLTAIDIVKRYYASENFKQINISEDLLNKNFTYDNIQKQLQLKIKLINAIESFLLAHAEIDAIELAMRTLAYQLADEKTKELLKSIFEIIKRQIDDAGLDPDIIRSYGKTLYSIKDIKVIEDWLIKYQDNLLSAENYKDIINIIWNLVYRYFDGIARKLDKDILINVVLMWIEGNSFVSIFEYMRKNCKIKTAKRVRDITMEETVELCEKEFSYNGALCIGAFAELITNKKIKKMMRKLQKQIQYGLKEHAAIILYELGFCDRIVVQDLINSMDIGATNKLNILQLLKNKVTKIEAIIEKYPSYFSKTLNDIIHIS